MGQSAQKGRYSNARRVLARVQGNYTTLAYPHGDSQIVHHKAVNSGNYTRQFSPA